MPPVTSRKVGTSIKVEPYSTEMKPNDETIHEEVASLEAASYLLDRLTKDARKMYSKMMSIKETGHVYTQVELADMVGVYDPLRLMGLIQENMNMVSLSLDEDVCSIGISIWH